MKNQELKKQLELSVKDGYNSFYNSVLRDCERYAGLTDFLTDYLSKNPKTESSNVLDAVDYYIGVPYSDENGIWYRRDKKVQQCCEKDMG